METTFPLFPEADIKVMVRVLNTGDAETTGAPVGRLAVLMVEEDPVTGHTVVETKMVSVVTKVVLAVAGQFVTVDGHAVIVAVRVEKTVEVVNCSTGWDCPAEPVGTAVTAVIAGALE